VIKAAGIMFLNDAGEVLLLKRGPGGDWPGAWCFPGGKQKGDETPEQTAVRECEEELGYCPPGPRRVWARRISDNQFPPGEEQPADVNPVPPIGDPVDYTTFLQRVEGRFDPQLNGEHTDFAWCSAGSPRTPLHPGARVALEKLSMDELGVARAIMQGDLVSPQHYENVWLFALRITGTGTAYRSKIDEYVYRKPENYLNQHFLDRCNGLPVIWEHPKAGKLDSKEFINRVIGTILLPYIQGEEVWGIAKIYDDEAAMQMASKQLSTSPAVVFRQTDGNVQERLEDGSNLLIEGKPSLLDHLAICEEGVWDKGGPPAGVELPETIETTSGGNTMAEIEKEMEGAEKRADMDGGNLDKLLMGIDALCSRMDKMHEAHQEMKGRLDSMADLKAAQMAKAADDDDDMADNVELEVEEPQMVRAGGAPPAMMADAEMPEALKKADDDMKADSARRAANDAHVAAEIRRLSALVNKMPKSMSDADYAAMADYQARADSVYSAFGERAPAPLQGEAAPAYRIRLAKGMQSHSSAWKDVPLRDLPENALDIAEAAIYADATAAARSPVGVSAGSLRAIKKRDAADRVITEFVGEPSAWMGEFRTAPRAIAKPFFRRNAMH
jgi:8-oxo-dGTP pyrophosphatase MutT (NUDIX family)